MTRPIRRTVMTKARTPESLPYEQTTKKKIWIINKSSFIYLRCAGLSHYALQGFHCQRAGAGPILSLHALRCQIPEIYLPQWHHHCSNANSQPSLTNFPSLTVHHPARHWCFPTSLVETRIFHNPRPVVIRTFPNTKRLHLR